MSPLEALEILVVTYAMDDAQGALNLEAIIKPVLEAALSPSPSDQPQAGKEG